jgi:hypothetical protein
MEQYWGSPEWKWFTLASVATLFVGIVAALLVR